MSKLIYLIPRIILFSVVGVLYYLTLANGVMQIDSGELATVQYTLGTAHPTGYPLFTLLGYLFSHIPTGLRPIYQLNLVSLIYGLGGLAFLFLTFRSLSTSLFGKSLPKYSIAFELISSVIIISFGLNPVQWDQVTATEVYSLHICLLTFICWRLSIAWFNPENLTAWLWVAVGLGLGFSNHMTTLLILPGIAVVYFGRRSWKEQVTWRHLGMMIGLFIIILVSTYGWLCFRAGQQPDYNWGNPDTLGGLFRHVSGWQYRVWLFSSPKVMRTQLGAFFQNLPIQLTWVGLILFLAGIYFVWKKNKNICIWWIVNFLFTAFYASNYDIHDLDPYYLLAYISCFIFMGFALTEVWIKWPKLTWVWVTVAFIPSILFIYSGFRKQDRSEVFVFEDYTRAVFNSVAPNSLLFSYQWDYLVSPSYYLQAVEGLRPDVCMIDKELLRRSWYYPQLTKKYPQVMLPVKNEVDLFLTELAPMESGSKNFNAQKLESLYRQIMTGIIGGKLPENSVYVGIEVFQNEIRKGEVPLPKGYTLIPEQYFLKLIPDSAGYQALDFKPSPIRFMKIGLNSYGDEIRKLVASMASFRSSYELSAGYPDRSREWAKEAQRVLPGISLPREVDSLLSVH
jgi:hypothetical protein